MRVALYSAIYGASDWVKPMRDLGVPCVMFTDNPHLVAPGWEVRVVPHWIATRKGDPAVTAPMLAHKFWKTHPAAALPEVEVSLWIDGSMEVLVDDYVDRCLAALGDDDWSCVPHPSRQCVYAEADYSATLTHRYDAPSILAQRDFYRGTVGYPGGRDLVATGANVRRHTPNVIELGQHWWSDCLLWSHQDQLSLPVLLWLYREKVKWNLNLPWFQWWHLHEHGPVRLS